MARPLRIEYEGAFYHITARGNEKRRVFLSKADYEKFLANLRTSAERFSVVIHCYVLMGNHYHLIVETPKANLSSFMHAIQSGYTTYFNIKERPVRPSLSGEVQIHPYRQGRLPPGALSLYPPESRPCPYG